MRGGLRIGAALLLVGIAASVAGCGDGYGVVRGVAPAPSKAELQEPASGTLRVFAYGDTTTDEMLDPFREANPDLDLKIASFNSNKAAAAKLAGGFEADVVEVCTDEMEPLTARALLRPLDPDAIADFDRLALSDSDDVRDAAGNVLFVPASAGPHGLIVNTEEIPPGTVTSYDDLFDPAYAGNVALESSDLTALGVSAMAIGLPDPMNLSLDEISETQDFLASRIGQFRALAESDASMVNLFKSGEVALADGGRGTAQDMVADGVPVEWVPPDEGVLSWVCGLAFTSNAENVDAGYKLMNYYASPEAQAISAESGFIAMNPGALKLLPPALRADADPASLDTAIPETQPEFSEAYARAWQEVEAG